MMIEESVRKLISFCSDQEYKGYDPFDGLNSKLFKYSGLSKFYFFRLFWVQLFKRNPVNIRRLVGIDKEYNSKGLGLFLSSY